MPQDNTQDFTDNSQMATQMPYSNDATNMGATGATFVPPAMPSSDVVAPVATEPYDDAQVQAGAPMEPVGTPDNVATVVQDASAQEQANVASVNYDIPSEIVAKINESKNVLIALSADPSVDELSAAIGLSLYLDRIGKRATAIYSGATPNTLEFLKPEETFEPSADTLQDFVIAINKEKADHLRYKLDGDYVKVYITPYKHKITEDDLEFSYGDYNVDLVIALDVANGIDLDSALREHGRIMHDASIINVTTGNPGKFGEIEWSDKKASSVSEMIAELLYALGGENQVVKDEATAFLTGVVAATDRFSNARTTPETMRLASRLMESGANQQLVAKNITPNTENEIYNNVLASPKKDAKDAEIKEIEDELSKEGAVADTTKLDIEHKHDEKGNATENDSPDDNGAGGNEAESNGADGNGAESNGADNNGANAVNNDEVNSETVNEVNADVTKKEHTLLDDLKAAEESLSHTGAETTPEDGDNMLKIENGKVAEDTSASEPTLPEVVTPEASAAPEPTLPEVMTPETPATTEVALPEINASQPVAPEPAKSETITPEASTPEVTAPESAGPEATASGVAESGGGALNSPENGSEFVVPEAVISPSSSFNANGSSDSEKYGQMLQDAINSDSTSVEPETPIMSGPDASDNPAASGAPAVPVSPEINGVPEMNYAPIPGTEILPPPPTPPIADLSQAMPPTDGAGVQPITPAVPVMGPEPTPLGEQPAMQDQVYNAQANDPGAFKIPGM